MCATIMRKPSPGLEGEVQVDKVYYPSQLKVDVQGAYLSLRGPPSIGQGASLTPNLAGERPCSS